MKLLSFPSQDYQDYRLKIIFDGYKWDPQFSDNNTIAPYYLVLSQKEHQLLVNYVEKLGRETEAAENFLYQNRKFLKPLKLPFKIKDALRHLKNYQPDQHLRLMRFDFHPILGDDWAISEVNSDVPGGFAESSYMPEIALKYLKQNNYQSFNFIDQFIFELTKILKPQSTIMLVHCTSYSDDRQVMQAIGDKLAKQDHQVIYGAADHIKFVKGQAVSILDLNQGPIDAIIRFNPIEWVVSIQPRTWYGYFKTTTLSCNHPIAVITQSKRFPLIWNNLEAHGLSFQAWRKLLPETRDSRQIKGDKDFIYKPVWGRVGEGITILEASRDDEYQKTLKDVKRHPRKYIAQKRFSSLPIKDENGKEFHLSLGIYYLAGKFAGYYGRISDVPRIDSHASELAVFVEGENDDK